MNEINKQLYRLYYAPYLIIIIILLLPYFSENIIYLLILYLLYVIYRLKYEFEFNKNQNKQMDTQNFIIDYCRNSIEQSCKLFYSSKNNFEKMLEQIKDNLNIMEMFI